MLTEKRKLKSKNPHEKGTVAENLRPWHGAGTSGKAEQQWHYIRLLTSEGVQNRRLGESKEQRRNVDRTTDLLEVRARNREASHLPTTVAAVTACGSPATTTILVDCNSVKWPLNNSCNFTTTASIKTFRCATECESRWLSYKIYKLK